MKDSTTMGVMMDRIASNRHMRRMVMHSARNDTTSMIEMYKMMMDHKNMHSMMNMRGKEYRHQHEHQRKD